MGLSRDSHATMMAVKPYPAEKPCCSLPWRPDTSHIPAIPAIAPEMNMTRITFRT